MECSIDEIENLVVNGDFSDGNAGFSTDFDYDCNCIHTSICVGSEGRDKCSNPLWFYDTWDHTNGDASGKYLIVDGRASTFHPDKFWYTNVEVTSGKKYVFSFWLNPKLSSPNSPPILQMYIGDILVGGLITESGTGWRKVCITWIAGSTSNKEISIRQVNHNGWGMDFGIDVIVFGTCPTIDDCGVNTKFTYFASPDCNFSFFDQSSAGDGSTLVGWSWTFGDGYSSTESTPSHYYSNPGTYEVCLTVTAINLETGECCSDTYL